MDQAKKNAKSSCEPGDDLCTEVTAELLASFAIEWGGDTQPTARASSHLWLAVSCTAAMKQSQSGHWPAKTLLPSN